MSVLIVVLQNFFIVAPDPPVGYFAHSVLLAGFFPDETEPHVRENSQIIGDLGQVLPLFLIEGKQLGKNNGTNLLDSAGPVYKTQISHQVGEKIMDEYWRLSKFIEGLQSYCNQSLKERLHVLDVTCERNGTGDTSL